MRRNVTSDNFFTSLELAKKLKKKFTSLVGTVNRGRREIPVAMKIAKDPLYTTKVYRAEDTTLTVYQGKKQKNVMVLSTLHPSVHVESSGKKIPETIDFYNKTKFGVVIIDQMARQYSVKAPARRWPVHTFYNILDLAAINAYALYKEVTGESPRRKEFLRKLAEELRAKYINNEDSSDSSEEEVEEIQGRTRKKCQIGRCKNNKTADICRSCKPFVCGTCCGKIRKNCLNCM